MLVAHGCDILLAAVTGTTGKAAQLQAHVSSAEQQQQACQKFAFTYYSHLSNVQLVQDGGLASSIKADLQSAHTNTARLSCSYCYYVS